MGHKIWIGPKKTAKGTESRAAAQAECDRANEPIEERRILALAALDWHRSQTEPLVGAAAVRELTSPEGQSDRAKEIWQKMIALNGHGPNRSVTPGGPILPGAEADRIEALPTVADVEPIAAAMTDTPPSIREPADADDRGPARTWGTWQAPPRRRRNITSTARLPGAGKVHLTIDLDDAGHPCAIWIEVHKEGSIVRGMLDAAAALASQGLQHGASIHEVAERMIGVQFEPDGAVEGHALVKECLSIVDLLGRMIEAEFPRAPREDVLADEAARRAGGGK